MSDSPRDPTLVEAGFARLEITAYEPGMAMLGWGHRRNQVGGVAQPLHARAVVVGSPALGTKVAYLSAELLLISQGLRQTVIDRLRERPGLGLGHHNVVMAANHTHSGPSGYSHHFWINLAAPGFSRRVYDHLADRFVEAIVAADRARVPARLRLGQAEVPLSAGIAFNRSWRAYSRNRDVEPVTEQRRDEATDRTLTVLRVETAEGRPLGALTWLAVHCTSVHADNHLLHPDNKGVASARLESDVSGADGPFVAIFAQEAAGDVSPNYRYDPSRRLVIGRYDDDFESAEYVGAVQASEARRVFEAAAREPALEARIDSAIDYVDFAAAPASARYSADGRYHQTSPARVGLAMIQGTAEGPGPLLGHRWVQHLSAARRAVGSLRAALPRPPSNGRLDPGRLDPKVPFLDVGAGVDGHLLGLFSLRRFRLPGVDPTFAWVKGCIRSGALRPGPWIPQVLPLQIVRIGSLAIAALPFEATTIAGRRLRRQLARRLGPEGVDTVVVSPYANAYAGYATTFEEYQAQAYEGGYTLFGPHTLAAIRTGFDGLASGLGPATADRHPAETAPRVPIEAVERVRFESPWPDRPYRRKPRGRGGP